MAKGIQGGNLILGIDATNIRRGGGVTHLLELLSSVIPEQFGIDRIVVWASVKTLDALDERPWLKKCNIAAFNGGLLNRVLWQKLYLSKVAEEEGCNLLLIPGGIFLGNFRTVVTISQNLLPFEKNELLRYGFSLFTVKMYLLRIMQLYTFRRVKGVIFLTEYAQKTVLQIAGGLNGLKCIIPHGVNPRFKLFPKEQLHIDCYSHIKPYRILYVSIIDKYKHQWHVIEAVAILRRLGMPVVLDLVGPACAPALLRMSASLKQWDPQNNWAFYHGEIPFNLLHYYYKKADLGLFASSCENMPNILLETMASGLPIACSNRGPMPEVLGPSGVYFNPEMPSDIARAMRELISSPQLRTYTANLNYEKSRQFSWERCSAETFRFLVDVSCGSK